MPKAVEMRLRKVAGKRGYNQQRTNSFVYGTMNKMKKKFKKAVSK